MTFRSFGVEKGWIFRTTADPSGNLAFNFYMNVGGDIVTVSDPLSLAQLLIEGSAHDPEEKVKTILRSHTTKRLMLDPKIVLWDSRWGDISFKTWLINELMKIGRGDLVEKINAL